MVGVKGHSSHAEEESSALLPAKDRQMKATWVTCQLHKEIDVQLGWMSPGKPNPLCLG